MRRRTKIVCTLGPAVDTQAKIRELIDAGMNVARLNCSHGDWVSKRRWIDWIRSADSSVGILADLQGPKFRIGLVAGGQITVKIGQSLTLGSHPEADVPVQEKSLLAAIDVGCRALVGDGEVELKVVSGGNGSYVAKAVCGGVIRSRQGLTIPNRTFDAPSLSEKDLDDLREAVEAGCDMIALSYVKTAKDILDLRDRLSELDPTVFICAKIETPEALQHIDTIIHASDAIMVARGDLGLQIDIEEVPLAQKRIIRKCVVAGKPVITATQMLESMIVNARPTRAEAADVSNAILDGTDAVMLSGETAMGAHPIEAVEIMAKIAQTTDTALDRELFEEALEEAVYSRTLAFAHSAANLVKSIKPKAVVCTSTSGQTPRLLSRFRPRCPILCATWHPKTKALMSFVWGVDAIAINLPLDMDEILRSAVSAFVKGGRLKSGDLIVLTAGVPAGTAGNTNMILMEEVK